MSPQPVLNFVKPPGKDPFIVRSSAHIGDSTYLVADYFEDIKPTTFTVVSKPEGFIDAILTRIARNRHVRGQMVAVPSGARQFTSRDAYTVNGTPYKTRPLHLFFRDDLGNSSVSSLDVWPTGSVTIRQKPRSIPVGSVVNAGLAATGAPPLLPDVDITLSTEERETVLLVESPIDPPVTARLLFPWGQGPSLRDYLGLDDSDGGYLREVSDFEQVAYAQIQAQLMDLYGDALRPEPIIEASLSASNFFVEEARPYELTISVEALRPGRTLFAVQVTNEATDTQSTSEIIEIQVRRRIDGTLALHQLAAIPVVRV